MLENSEVQVPCPECKTLLTVKLIQIANEESITCVGCHRTIHLKDENGKAKEALNKINRSLGDIRKKIDDINRMH